MMKGGLVIARVETTCYYEGHDERIYQVKSLYDWQPFCYIGEKGEMMCSGRFKPDMKLHPSCKECVYWKGYKE
jgi:hypothetical protein